MRSDCVELVDWENLPGMFSQSLASGTFSNADAVKNMKTSWSTFYSPDVKSHLHPTYYNYIQFKHTSFYLVPSSFSSSSKLCSGWCSRFLPRRFQIWILVVFPALAWVFSWVWTCQFGTDVWAYGAYLLHGIEKFCSIFVEEIAFLGWQIVSILNFSRRISLRWSHGGQPALEWIGLDDFGMLNEGVFS